MEFEFRNQRPMLWITQINYAVATNFAVIELAVGYEVWIQSGTWHSGQVAGDDLSSIAGWLLD